MSTDSTKDRFHKGQAVAYVSDGTARILRVICREWVRLEGTGMSQDAAWETAGRPWRCVGADNEVIVLPESDIAPLVDGVAPSEIAPTRFGETPTSVKAFLKRFCADLVISTVEGHTKLATADPHYWCIWDRLDSVVTPEGYDYDRVEVVDDDASAVYDPLDWLEGRWEDAREYRHDDKGLFRAMNNAFKLLATGNEMLVPPIGDESVAMSYTVDEKGNVVDTTCSVPDGARYVRGIYAVRPNSAKRVLSDGELATVVKAAVEHDIAEYDETNLRVVYVRDVWGPAPHAVFLTNSAAERYLEQNRHHHHSNAHVYLDCASRSPEYERLLSVLRQLDVERCHFETHQDPTQQ